MGLYKRDLWRSKATPPVTPPCFGCAGIDKKSNPENVNVLPSLCRVSCRASTDGMNSLQSNWSSSKLEIKPLKFHCKMVSIMI
jgi:hypothetical protein